jgi:uncharacterized membrane protein YgdD (TMEM256/DUF423 family)
MKKQIIITAAVFGALAVIMGAFGAHSIQGLISAKNLEVWHTAVQYQFYHVFALLFLALLKPVKPGQVKAIYYLFSLGILFFSGSLYLLACRDVLNWGWLPIMGPITPIGGLLFIAGWITLAVAAFRNKID